MIKRNAADVLVERLVQHGVDTVFAMPGDQLTPLFSALNEQGDKIKVIHPRHEQGAAYMAYGYARVSGRVGVMIVPPGPGLLNSMAGISVAYATSTPLLCITGQIPSDAIGKNRGLLHELPDQLNMVRSLTKYSSSVLDSEKVGITIDKAFVHLQEGRKRPVVLEIPPDILRSPANSTPLVSTNPIITLDLSEIEKAADLLRNAAKPLIFAGGGAIEAANSLVGLAQAMQIPIVSNSGARGILSDRSYLSLTWPAAHQLWKDADVVLAVGTRLAQPRYQWGIDNALKIIRIDIDPVELLDARPSDIAILGDASKVVPLLELSCVKHQATSRRDELTQLKLAWEARFAALSPQHEYVTALRNALPEDGVIVDELTQIGYSCRYSFPAYLPRTYITSGYQGALGYGFATSLGVKVAYPKRTVVSINGDGGFLYAAAELATAVQQKIGVVAVVFNDNSFGNILREQVRDGYAIASELHNPDFSKFASSFGARVARVTSPDALQAEIEVAGRHDLPTVIEVPVGAMPSPWHFIRLPKVRGNDPFDMEG